LSAGKWKIIKEIDSVAVDRVQSELLSGELPITANKTEKYSDFCA
jgi:hypothetical protein